MRKIVTLLALLIVVVCTVHAQSKTVRGRVISQSGEVIPFSTILVKNSQAKIVTNADGLFSIKAKEGDVLVATAVNISPAEETVTSADTITIRATLISTNLSEVVVTALGIRREAKAVGYSTQQVSGSQINQADATSTLSALSGKVAGADVTNSSGTPGAATYIRLRGITSLGGDGQPLMVVDGMPIDNSTSGLDASGLANNVQTSNRGIDINPDDIESISVIKGSAGAALYGTLGSNGVILITTKKGKRNSKFDITYSYGATWDKVNKLPKLQNLYSQGSRGKFSGPGSYTELGDQYTAVSWGAAIDTLRWTGTANDWDSHGDIVGASNASGTIPVTPYDRYDFFQTGLTQQHNVSVSGGNSALTYRFSYANLNQTGIIPNSKFQRNSFDLSLEYKLSDKLTTGASVLYSISGGQRVQQGSNLNGVMLGLLRTPVTFDDGYVPNGSANSYEFPSGVERTYRGYGDATYGNLYYDNPYFTVHKNLYNDQTNRIIASTYLTYVPVSWLNITDRIGVDQGSQYVKQFYAVNSSSYNQPFGQVQFASSINKVVNNDLTATLSHKFGNILDGSFLLGSNYYSNDYRALSSTGSTLSIPNLYTLGNAQTILSSDGYSILRRKAFYAQLRLDINSYLFLTGTVRTENSSAFVSDKDTKGQWFTFPGVEGSFVFTDALKMNNSVLSFGKIRTSYGVAGTLPYAYANRAYYSTQTITDGWVNNGLTYPSPGGQVGYFEGSLASNGLKPERTGTFEAGTDLRFVKDRIGLSFTYYNSTSKDLLLFEPVSATTGSTNIYANAATIKNHGIEVTLNATPVKVRNFTWNLTANFSMNRSKVASLGNGVTSYFLAGFGAGEGSAYAIPGQPYGVIYGTDYLKDSKGNLIINDDSTASTPVGQPIEGPSSVVLGNPNPKWIAGLQNSFTFKQITLSVLFDTKQKFDVWNGTEGALTLRGLSQETADRGKTYTFSGVAGHVDVDGNTVLSGKANTNSTVLDQDFFASKGVVTGPYVQDGSFVKLREVALGYYLDFTKMMKHTYVKGINFSVVGRNLWLHTKYQGVDPETSLGGGNALGLDYFNNPGTRSVGLNAKINF